MSTDGSIPLSWVTPGAVFLVALFAVFGISLLIRWLLLRSIGRDPIDRVNRWVEGTLFLLILGAMIALSGLQVVLRNFFHAGFVWLDPLVRTLVLWMAFLGALTATGRARHIRIDVLGRMLPSDKGRILGRILAFLSAAVCALLANGAYVYLREEYLFGVSPFLGIPAWVAQSVLLLGFAMLSYRFLVQAIWPSPVSENS